MFPRLPPAPLLPENTDLQVPFCWRTWRGALWFYYKAPERPILPEEHAYLLPSVSLLAMVGVAPAEWVLHRVRAFELVREKIRLKRPPFKFVWSEKAIGDAIDLGLPFSGELSVPTVARPPGWDGDVLRTETEWKRRAELGEFLWCGAALVER